MSPENVWQLTPETIVMATAVVIYLGGAFLARPKLWAWLAAAGLAAAAAALWRWGDATIPPGPVVADPLAWYGRWLALALAGVLVLMSWRPLATGGTAEYLGSLLLTAAGLMLVAGAADLVLLFVGLELISIPTYILLYMGRRDAACQEATAKYFYLSLLASAMFLYGLSFLYGVAGSTHMPAIRTALAGAAGESNGFSILAKVAIVLILAGLSFRITAVPFHFYAPDVYQGTTHGNAALLSVIPKAAGLWAMMRLLLAALPPGDVAGWRTVLVLSVVTMTVGNVLALWQDNLRRLLAYSAVANAGYLLIGLAVGLATTGSGGTWDGLGAMLFYLCVYAAATLGLFAAFIYLGRPHHMLEAVDELAGLGRLRPAVAVLMALCLFSLAGLPPLGGLWGKLMLFGSALAVEGPHTQHWFTALAVIGVLNAVVAAWYYLRIVGVMYFRAPVATPRGEGGRGALLATVLCALFVLALGVYPGPLSRASRAASPTTQQPANTAYAAATGRVRPSQPSEGAPWNGADDGENP